MRIEIIGRNYNVPDRLKSVIERKFEKLNKYFDKKETESKLSSYIEKDGAVAKFVCTQEKIANATPLKQQSISATE